MEGDEGSIKGTLSGVLSVLSAIGEVWKMLDNLRKGGESESVSNTE